MSEEIRSAIEKALTELGIEQVDFVVEHPEELSHGDYASNVAMVAAKRVGKDPQQFAKQIAATLDGKLAEIKKIEVAGPGFINFFLKRNFFSERIAYANKESEQWGRNKSLSRKKVVIEYTDLNPFKEFHIGHLFTNSVGESIARLFMMADADTKRVNYQGDVGLHVACALYGMQQMGFAGVSDFSARDLGEAYVLGNAAYRDDEKAKEEIVIINKLVYERSDEVINALYDKGREVSLAYFEDIYALLGTKFDAYFFESETGEKGKQIVLDHPELFTESEGARIFEGEKYGLHTRVFLNSEGLPTYEAKELALAKLKEERLGKYDLSVISTSNEISEYFKVLKKAMSFVFPELEKKTEHIGHGTVRLESGKMSSRTGEVISALGFIEEIAHAALKKMRESDPDADQKLAEDIAVGAIKYATLKGNISQDSVFDKNQALSFEGNSGPYLQYTHARSCSVLKKAKEAGITSSTEKAPAEPYEIERILYRFPEVILRALEEREPHQVVGFLTELAGVFNTFYGEERIADSEDEYAPYKVALTEAVKITLANGLWVLGIKAPEHM